MAVQSFLGLPRNPTFESNDGQDYQVHLESLSLIRDPGLRLGFDPFKVDMFDGDSGKKININYKKGTTTLAFKYQGTVPSP